MSNGAITRDLAQVNQARIVEGRRTAWKRNFNGTSLNLDSWSVVSQGAGQSYSVAGGQLTMNGGVNANEEMIIRSDPGFTIPFRLQVTHTLANRIANQEVYIEILNAAGDTYAGWMFDGTVTTTAKTTHANGGVSTPASPTAGITVTASSGPVIREIDVKLDSVEFADRNTDSTSNNSVRATKTRTTLDPYEVYYVQFRIKNLGTAPASNTAHIIESVLMQDTNDVLVEVSGGRGNNSSTRATAVVINNQPSVYANPAASTLGGAATINRQAALTNTGVLIKSTAGKVLGFTLANPGAASAWVHFYNKNTAPVVGTDIPVVSILVPVGETKISDNFYGLNFSAGIGIGASDNSAVTSAVAPATALVAQTYYV